MYETVLLLSLLSFVLLGMLPIVVFRHGRLNLAWWLTAAPFFADAALLLAALGGMIQPLPLPGDATRVLALAAVPIIASAFTLIGCTAGVHRTPVSLWHQRQDTPAALVTWGPYARVRHPFYAAFILMLIGAAAALPHPATLLMAAAGAWQLRRTARREERRLLSSQLGVQYAQYLLRTGRFLPRFRT